MAFEANPAWEEIEKPSVGDIVHLKFVHKDTYKVKLVITETGNDEIVGKVDCLFDWDENTPIPFGLVYREIGEMVRFRPLFIFKLIKEKDAKL